MVFIVGTGASASSTSSGRSTSRSSGRGGLLRQLRKGAAACALVVGLSSTQGVHAICESPTETIDENTKMCRSKCHLMDGEAQPKFWQWEEYCLMTVANTEEQWDPICYNFYNCVFGCDIFGGDSTQFSEISYHWSDYGQDRVDPVTKQVLMMNIAPQNILKEQKCDAEKCRSYCSRQHFGTCRELQYSQSCDQIMSKRFYECDGMLCDAADRKVGALSTLAVLLMSVIPMGLYWNRRERLDF